MAIGKTNVGGSGKIKFDYINALGMAFTPNTNDPIGVVQNKASSKEKIYMCNFKNTLYALSSNTGYLQSSTDGFTWQDNILFGSTSTDTPNYLMCNGDYMVVIYVSSATSPTKWKAKATTNGTTWTTSNFSYDVFGGVGPGFAVQACGVSNGMFFIALEHRIITSSVRYDTPCYLTSSDGATWTYKMTSSTKTGTGSYPVNNYYNFAYDGTNVYIIEDAYSSKKTQKFYRTFYYGTSVTTLVSLTSDLPLANSSGNYLQSAGNLAPFNYYDGAFYMAYGTQGVYRSTNGAVNWSLCSPTAATYRKIGVFDGRVLCITQTNGIYEYINGSFLLANEGVTYGAYGDFTKINI